MHNARNSGMSSSRTEQICLIFYLWGAHAPTKPPSDYAYGSMVEVYVGNGNSRFLFFRENSLGMGIDMGSVKQLVAAS